MKAEEEARWRIAPLYRARRPLSRMLPERSRGGLLALAPKMSARLSGADPRS
jgi:hypothetical protein